jgi:type III secretory pathway component EscT
MMHVTLHFNQKCHLKMGGGMIENLEGISVSSYFHVYENEDAVSHGVIYSSTVFF